MIHRESRTSHHLIQGIISRKTTLILDARGAVKRENTVEKFMPLTVKVDKKPVNKAINFLLNQPRHRGSQSVAVEKDLERKFFVTERERRSSGVMGETNPWNRIIKGCNDLKQELIGQWTEATSAVTNRREEWVEAKNYYEAVKSRGPWKSNPVYSQKRALLESRLKSKTDRSKDSDKEIILQLASPTPPPTTGTHRRYVSLADMTPGRIQSMSRAAKRGFGGSPIPLEKLMRNLAKLKDPFATKSDDEDLDGFRGEKEEGEILENEKQEEIGSPEPVDNQPRTRVGTPRTRIGTPVNEFINKHRSRFLRNPISRINSEKKIAVELAMNRIHASPEIALKAHRIEEQARKRRIHYLKSKTFRTILPRPATPGENTELKAEIQHYRQSTQEEISQGKGVRSKLMNFHM